MGRALTITAGWLLAMACGGQSVVTEDGDAGRGAMSGSAGQQGSGGKAGTGTGGRASGGAAGSNGGASAGSPAAGSAGTGSSPEPRCAQPLESGVCNAYIPSYGFDTSARHCRSFVYGGCGGNDNRFKTLAECESACGGTTLGECPETQPTEGSLCTLPAERACTYDELHCLCAKIPGSCPPVDPLCTRAEAPPKCTGADCPTRVVISIFHRCTCSPSGWRCTIEDAFQ